MITVTICFLFRIWHSLENVKEKYQSECDMPRRSVHAGVGESYELLRCALWEANIFLAHLSLFVFQS